MIDMSGNHSTRKTITGSTTAYRETADGVEQGVILPDGNIRWLPGLDLCPFHDGRSTVMHKETLQFGVIDREGNMVLPCTYAGITNFSEGRAFIWDETTRLIDVNGTVLREFTDSPVGDAFHYGLAILSTIDGEEKFDGFIDRSGAWVIPPIYRNPITAPAVHDEDDRLSNGLIRIRRGDRTGYINRSGAMVIEPAYERGGRFSQGRAWVRLDGFTGFINTDAEIAISLMLQGAGAYGDGLAPVCFDGLWGYIDLAGDIVLEPQFLMARSFANSEALVLTEAGWGTIDCAGRFTIPPMYDALTFFEDGIARATLHGTQGFIDRENRGIWGHRTALQSMR
jgi:hypothetical protein